MEKAKCAIDIESATPWVCEIPFQHVWVKAHMRQRELNVENPMELLEREFETLSHVHLYEMGCDEARVLRGVTIQQLKASCPFCKEGEHQILRSGNWVYIHDWVKEEHDVTAGSDQLPEAAMLGFDDLDECVGLNEAFFRSSIETWGDKGSFPVPEIPDGTNAYGVDLDDLRVVASGQLSMAFPELEFLSKAYGLSGYFGGLYRCPHCGNVFACVYRDPYHPRKQGRFELTEYINSCLDSMLAEAAAPERGEKPAYGTDRLVPTMAVTVERGDGRISVRANIAGRWHELVFDTERGSFLLDGSSYVRSGLNCTALAEHPLVEAGVFGVRKLVEELRRLLPPLPDGVEFHFGGGFRVRNALMLLVANRFVGYQASFYNSLLDSLRHIDFFALGTGLPRSYEDLPSYYQMTGLPDKKSLKRVLFERAGVLYSVLQTPDIPFRNVDILRRFFEHPLAVDYLRLINEAPRSCHGWRKFAEARGDAFVFDFLEANTCGALCELSLAFSAVDSEVQLSELFELAGRSSQSGFQLLFECWTWQQLHPAIPIKKPYAHPKEMLRLEWADGEFSVELPKCPREVIQASIELRNCLKSYAIAISRETEIAIFLMRRGDKIVAAMQVDADLVVSDARGKCNKPIGELDDLKGAFEMWVQARSLRFERQDVF